MSLTANAPHPAHQTGSASQAQRARPAQAGHASGSSAGPDSPFAQLLQGAFDEEPDAVQDRASGEPDADDADDEPHAASRKKDEHATADAATPQPPAPDAPPADRAQSLSQAGLMAAARAKAADTLARGRRAAAGAGDLAGASDAARSDRASGLGLGLGLGHAGAVSADQAAGGLDISGFQRVLDATPVNLAAADAALAPAAGAADFSLPSLGAGGNAAAQPVPEPPPAQATLAPPPGSAAFPAALGAQLNTWLKDGVQYATLELNPQDMGPIDVRIALHGGRTEVELGASVAETRAALADALPALADALGDVGLSLSGGSVSDQTGQHAREGDPQGQRAFAMPGWLAPGRDADGTAATVAARPGAQRGLVDLVA